MLRRTRTRIPHSQEFRARLLRGLPTGPVQGRSRFERNRCALSCRRTAELSSNPDTIPSRTASEIPSALADDRTLLYDILTRAGLDGHDAYLFTQLVEEMASANLIHRFESKLESMLEVQNAKLEIQNAKLDAQNAKLDAQSGKFNLMLWFIGIGLSMLLALNVIGNL